MYTLLHTQGLRSVLAAELPSFIVSLIIAQLFFKWGSFALELLGFLLTWFAVSYLQSAVARLLAKPSV